MMVFSVFLSHFNPRRTKKRQSTDPHNGSCSGTKISVDQIEENRLGNCFGVV